MALSFMYSIVMCICRFFHPRSFFFSNHVLCCHTIIPGTLLYYILCFMYFIFNYIWCFLISCLLILCRVTNYCLLSTLAYDSGCTATGVTFLRIISQIHRPYHWYLRVSYIKVVGMSNDSSLH